MLGSFFGEARIENRESGRDGGKEAELTSKTGILTACVFWTIFLQCTDPVPTPLRNPPLLRFEAFNKRNILQVEFAVAVAGKLVASWRGCAVVMLKKLWVKVVSSKAG